MEGKEGSLYGDSRLLFPAPARLLRAGRGTCTDVLNGVRDACTWYDALKADGKFGASTQRAVQEFQLKNKMNMDGKVGQNT